MFFNNMRLFRKFFCKAEGSVFLFFFFQEDIFAKKQHPHINSIDVQKRIGDFLHCLSPHVPSFCYTRADVMALLLIFRHPKIVNVI